MYIGQKSGINLVVRLLNWLIKMLNECSSLCELLYIISNYEKSTIGKLHWWSFKKKKRLKKSFEIILQTVSYLESADKDLLRNKVYEDIILYVQKYRLIDDAANVIKSYFEMHDLQSSLLDDNSKVIVYRMTDVLEKMKHLILPHIKTAQKKEIFIYLHALHNLPKALITKSKDTIIYGVVPISANEAIEYADYWLDRLN